MWERRPLVCIHTESSENGIMWEEAVVYNKNKVKDIGVYTDKQ